MRLERLRLVNFRQHADTDIAFGPGLTAIVGPNGAGKTTLLEAIAWAVYGTDAARGNKDGLRWRRAKPRSEVRVELAFWLGPQRYRVTRTLYQAELFLGDAQEPVATSLAEVTGAERAPADPAQRRRAHLPVQHQDGWQSAPPELPGGLGQPVRREPANLGPPMPRLLGGVRGPAE